MNTLLEQLVNWDRNFFLSLNGCHSNYFDGFMWMVSSILIWIPVALTILFVIYKNKRRGEFFFILFGIIITIVLCDQISASIIKPLVARWRPSREPLLEGLVHLVNGYTGGKYGFVSSHAANSFGLAMFSALIFRYKPYTFAVLLWALINSYSRIYLGVHYPLDIICGTLLGIVCSLLVYFLIVYLKKFYTGFSYKPVTATSITSSGFEHKSIWAVIASFIITFIFIAIFAFEMTKFIRC